MRNIQETIIASFLWADDMMMDKTDAFILDSNRFDKDLNLIVQLLNKETDDDKMYGQLLMEMENTMQDLWLRLSTRTPMPFSVLKRLYEKLGDKNKTNTLKGL